MDVGTVPKVDTGSDHRLVRAKVRINKKMERVRRVRKPRRRHINLELLSSKQEQFQLELHNRFEVLADSMKNQPLDTLLANNQNNYG